VRRATLVPGFPVSWAAEGRCGAIGHVRDPPGRGRRTLCPFAWCGAAPDDPVPNSGSGQGASSSPPGGDNGHSTAVWRFRPPGQRDCNPMWPGLRQALCRVPIHQYSNHAVMVVSGDRPVRVRRRGSDFHEGGNTVGGQGAAKWCAGLLRPSDEGFFGGTDDPDRRTFRSLECPRPSGHQLQGSADSARHLVAP
jgi:hypothetical protein